MKSLYSFRLTNKLLSTDSSVTISNVRFRNTAASFTSESLVFTTDDGTTFEMAVGSAAAGVLTLTKRGLDNTDTKTEVSGNKKDRGAGTLVYVSALASDIFDKDAAGIQTESGGVVFSGNNIFTGTNVFSSTTAATLLLQNVTTAQMNALTGVANGAMVYNTDAGNTYQYIGGAWAAVASGSTPNASELVAGKVQEATQAEFDAGTKTGSNADLFATPDKVQKMIYTATPKTNMVAADFIGIADSQSSGINKSITLSNLETQLTTDIIAPMSIGGLTDSTYPTGESVSVGQAMFIESAILTGAATTKTNVGDATGNTRRGIPVISTGIFSSTFKINLCKAGSPSTNNHLHFRLETDNAGVPSGTLVDANAICDIAGGSLTTSLVETTMTWAGTFTAPIAGTKCHLVLWQGITYGSEVIDGVNYYQFGASALNSTTRGVGAYNGTTWGAYYKYDSFTGTSVDPTYRTLTGANMSVNNNITFQGDSLAHALFANKLQSISAYSDTSSSLKGTITGTGTLSNASGDLIYYFDANNYIQFGINFGGSGGGSTQYINIIKAGVSQYAYSSTVAGNEMKIEYNKGTGSIACYTWSGSAWTQFGATQTVAFTGNYYLMFSATGSGGTMGSTMTSYFDDFYYSATTYSTENPTNPLTAVMAYTSSNMFQNKVLSLTDSDYDYKIDLYGISTQNRSVGTYPKLTIQGVNANQTGLDYGSDYFLGQTPGAIVTTTPPTVNICKVGTAISPTAVDMTKTLSKPITLVAGTTYKAGRSGIVNAFSGELGSSGGGITGYADFVDGTTIVSNSFHDGSVNSLKVAISFPVVKGQYFKVDSGTITFFPL